MLDALYTAASGMLAQQIGLDVIANNLANVNTVGYKGQRAAFEDLLYNNIDPPRAPTQGQQMGLGVAISGHPGPVRRGLRAEHRRRRPTS